MDTVVDPSEVGGMETVAIRRAAHETPATLTTTLYDLVAAIQTALAPGQEELVVPIVTHLLRAGGATLLGDVGRQHRRRLTPLT